LSLAEVADSRALISDQVRKDFPILERRVHGHPVTYLDSAATSQKPRQVIEALTRYYEHSNANVHRGVYLLAEEATELYECARQSVADFIGADDPAEIIFTRNATESINLIMQTWGRATVCAGDTIVITPMEHHSNFVPWQQLAESADAQLRLAPLTEDGRIDLDALRDLLSFPVRLISISAVSNVLGTINPIAEIAEMAHAAGAHLVVDAAQMAPHMPLNVRTTGADFIAFTGHKMLAPLGIGILWGRKELLMEMPPFLFGGEMIRKVTNDRSTWNEVPWKFEAGTPNVEGAVGLNAALDYLRGIGMQSIREHEKTLVDYALDALGSMPGLTIVGPSSAEERGGVVSFTVADIHPHDLASIVDRTHGVCIRAGHHCCQPLHELLGLDATTRASFYVYNSTEDVDRLCQGIHTARSIMKVT
jgi:cysteine desulfurase/selenocysteine lyase